MATVYFTWPIKTGTSSSTNVRANEVTMASGISTKAVTYSSAISGTYALVVSIANTTDSTPIFLHPIITAKSASGFTVTFNAQTDTANYVLEYITYGAV